MTSPFQFTLEERCWMKLLLPPAADGAPVRRQMMAFTQYLNIDGTDMPLPVSYDLALSDVEADSSGETGSRYDSARHRAIRCCPDIRLLSGITGVAQKAVRDALGSQSSQSTFLIQKQWSGDQRNVHRRFQNFLAHDTSRKGLWKVSFELKEY